MRLHRAFCRAFLEPLKATPGQAWNMGNLRHHKSVEEQLEIGQRLLNSEKGHLLIEYKKSLYNMA